MVTLKKVTEATDWPFQVPDLKDQLRISVSSDADDRNLEAYLDAAVELVEGLAGCSVMKQTWQLGLEQFPFSRGNDRWRMGRPILLPRGPLVTVTSIKYINVSGSDVTLDPSGYLVSKNEKPSAIYPPYSGTFPTAREVPDSVRVTYVAGMAVNDAGESDPALVRESVKMSIKFLAGHWYSNREPVPVDVKPEKLPYALETLICASKLYRFDWEAYYSC